MNKANAVQKFWEEFCKSDSEISPETFYQTWHFGSSLEMARDLCQLVLEGKKTATSSLVWEYENDYDNAPRLHGYSVITNFCGNPQCVIQTTELKILPFDEVDANFASDEGEGDQSLDHWREAHWIYFSRRCAEIGREPTNKMLVNCERFKLLYSKK